MCAMFEQVYALPGAEHQAAIHDRHIELHLGERSLEVCRHVIRSFVAVLVGVRALGRELIEKLLEVTATKDRMTDRKSTRLNSSHSQISYAVFCLKKKKKTNQILCH